MVKEIRTIIQEKYRTITKRVTFSNDHKPMQCHKFRRADNKSRWKFAKNHRHCFCCLLNHDKGNCLSKKNCGVNGCTRNHHQMLHKDKKQSGSIHNTNIPASQVILRVVTVQIMAGTVMNTFALCDEASMTTLIDASFAEQIGADGPEFCCRWMNKITKNYAKSKKVTFKIAGVGSESKWHVVSGAWTIPNLDLPRQTIEVDFLMRKYPYLPRDVLEKVDSVKPRVFIGQDNQTLVAREVAEPDTLGLIITKMKLSWIVCGVDNGGFTQEAIENICCEERDADLHDCVKKLMSLKIFAVVVTKIDRRKSEEERLSLKMMANTIQNVDNDTRWLCRIRTMST
jgi:hypothetical protein